LTLFKKEHLNVDC